MEFRKIEALADWQAAVALRNLVTIENQITVEEALEWKADADREGLDLRFISYQSGVASSYTAITEIKHAEEQGLFRIGIYVDPKLESAKKVYEQAVSHAESQAIALSAKRLLVDTRSPQAFSSETLLRLGFDLAVRFPVSSLVLEEPYVLESEIQIISYAEFSNLKPETWKQEVWRLEMDIAYDLPLAFEFKETPFEFFEQELCAPSIDHSTLFLALVEGQLAGCTQLFISKVDPRFVQTGLTGVRIEFRRKGVATALKKHSANYVLGAGAKEIFTDNEENNPMYQLNLQLGFKWKFDNLRYQKELLQ